MKVALIITGVSAVLGLSIWYEVTLWTECRIDHSWFYCLRVLSR